MFILCEMDTGQNQRMQMVESSGPKPTLCRILMVIYRNYPTLPNPIGGQSFTLSNSLTNPLKGVLRRTCCAQAKHLCILLLLRYRTLQACSILSAFLSTHRKVARGKFHLCGI